MPTMTEKYLTTNEVAERMRVSPVTVQNLLNSGELAGTRFGKKWLIKEEDLQEYIRSRSNRQEEKK